MTFFDDLFGGQQDIQQQDLAAFEYMKIHQAQQAGKWYRLNMSAHGSTVDEAPVRKVKKVDSIDVTEREKRKKITGEK